MRYLEGTFKRISNNYMNVSLTTTRKIVLYKIQVIRDDTPLCILF